MSNTGSTRRGFRRGICATAVTWGRLKSAWALGLLAALLPCGCRTPGGSPKASAHSEAGSGRVIWLTEVDLRGVDQGWGTPHADRSVADKPLTIAGHEYEHGLGTHAYSEFEIDLKQAATRFEAEVGVDDEVLPKEGDEKRGSVVFVVYVDDREAARSGVLRGGDEPEKIAVDLRGARWLRLVVEDAGDTMGSDHADWAEARLTLAPGAQQTPVAFPLVFGPEPVLMRETSQEPAIHAPRITGATPGLPFLFRIPASGAPPMRFEAENLPAGLKLNPRTGVITGALESETNAVVTVKVSNPYGVTSSELTIVGGEHCLALTPPMGWNSWNVWGTSVDDAKVRAAADWMVKSGLADYGYQYINIDDAWEAERDENGRIMTNEKFPDMRALADYVHGKGLKLGIYSSPGPRTCGGYEGSHEHEMIDAETFAEWGIDYLKYDWCSYGRIAKDRSREELMKPYTLMRTCLDECGRDIVYSLCQYGMGNVSEWGADVGGNLWRTTGDIYDAWASMATIGFGQAGLEEYAGPGHWNDPDMLVVGQVGWGPDLHPTGLTKDEQIAHITLWSMLAAPLLLGCDLSELDEFTLALLTNSEVLEVNQDPLGCQAGRVKEYKRTEVWARPLADGTQAVALFNRARGQKTAEVTWAELDLDGPQQVRDLWQREDLGVFEEGYSAPVSGHGAVMLKVSPAR
jgi:alpha-galactosidase